MAHAARRTTVEHKRGSGGQGRAPEPRFLTVGQVVGAHGVRGELKVEILTDDPERFGLLKQVFLGLEDQEPEPWLLEGYRLHKKQALLRLRGCDDRSFAETLYGYLVQVPFDEALPLEEGEYFEYQIVGLQVFTTSGEPLGAINEILFTGANEVYVVHGAAPGRRELLVPAIEGVVLEIDLAAGRVVVELPEGLP